MINEQNAWKLCGTTAQLKTELLEATVDTQRPELGLRSIMSRLNGQNLKFETARMLGLRVGQGDLEAVETTDYYVRGDDLIVSCRTVSAPHVGRQIYWRVVRDSSAPADGIAGIEVIVSAQTDLLDSDPAATVYSLLPTGDVLTSTADGEQTFQPLDLARGESTAGGGAVLIRCENTLVSFLEMVHPSDDRGTTLTRTDNQLTTSHAVLTERLEKGVIRRSRLRAMFLPREHDSAVAVDLYQRFAASPLPLTT